MKSSLKPTEMNCGAPYAPPSDKPKILLDEDLLIDPSVISIKDPTDYISDHPNIIPTIALSTDNSMLPTVQLNLAPSHITSSVTIFEPSHIPISPP